MKIKECFWWVFAIIGVCFLSIRCSNIEQDYCCYVNPFIGNADNGHTFPGACVPFGMIQVSPESGNGSWRYCSGFNIEDDSIMGFSQNHLEHDAKGNSGRPECDRHSPRRAERLPEGKASL